MKVYIGCPEATRGILRSMHAIEKYKPSGVQIVDDINKSDFVIAHAYGRLRKLKPLLKNRDYAILQLCIRRTLNPNTSDWMPLWEKAKAVWSYLDLKAFSEEDGNDFPVNFYHAPLGADKTVFKKSRLPRDYIIATSGDSWMHESVREAINAAKIVNEPVFHIGSQKFRFDHFITYSSGMPDETMARFYSRCKYVAGLRRTEGFELPAAEGILCGARPLMFDAPHYRKWFHDLATFIPEEGSRDDITEAIVNVFRGQYWHVTDEEIRKAQERFSWERITTEFWKICMS